MEEEKNVQSGTVYRCPACGGGIYYDIESGMMACKSCGRRASVAEIKRREPEPAANIEAIEYRCPQCGASLYTSQTSAVTFCSFCGANVVLTERVTQTKRPDKIVPFKITRERCETIYRKRLGQSWLAPKALKEQTVSGRFLPVYVPFYCYKHTYEGENTVVGRLERQDSKYYYSDEYECAINGKAIGNGLYECASMAMEPETAEKLSLADRTAVPFSPAYLCGFYAETPDLKVKTEHAVLRDMLKQTYTQKIRSACDLTSVAAALPKDSKREVSLVLLPVWLLSSRQGERMLYTAVNGVTGEIVCDTPVDRKAVGWVSAGLGLLFAVIFLLSSQTLILRAKLVTGLCAVVACAILYTVNQSIQWHKARDQRLRTRNAGSYYDPPEDLSNYDPPPLEHKGFWIGLAATVGIPFMMFMSVRNVSRLLYLFPIAAVLTLVIIRLRYRNKWKKAELLSPGILNWLRLHFLPMLAGLIAAVAFAAAISRNQNEWIANLIGENGLLAPFLCFCAVLSYLYAKARWDESADRPDFLLWIAQIVLACAACGLMIFGYSMDLAYYGITIAILGLATASMARLDRRFNDFVTRPVPFFGKEGKR